MRDLALGEPICGHCGADGTLQSADLPLRRLQLRAGGEDGGIIAIPALLELCRQSQRFGMKLARRIDASDEQNDYRLLLETEPSDDGVDFCITAWSERARADASAGSRRFVLGGFDTSIRFQLDSGLHIVAFDAGGEDVQGPAIGAKLTDWLTLMPDASSRMPMLEAVAERQDFRAQVVRLEARYASLSGHSLLSGTGDFAGYLCTLEPSAETHGDPLPLAPFPAQVLGSGLKRPLDRIVARAETIQSRLEGPIRENYADYARDIASAASHLKGLVEDFGDLDAVERADFTLEREPIDCAELARRAAGLLAVRAAHRNIAIDAPAERDCLQALGEYRRVLQILVNLIGNAVRYAGDGSAITVSTEIDDDGRPAVIVADEGDGIAPEDRERVFEKFERLGRSADGGSGLGLYISRRLARAMGGDLWIAPASRGARFVLSLPPA